MALPEYLEFFANCIAYFIPRALEMQYFRPSLNINFFRMYTRKYNYLYKFYYIVID